MRDVELATVPGFRQLLQVKAPLAHDWNRTATAMAGLGWWFTAYRADDLVANLRSVLAAELAAAGDQVPARQQAWTVLGQADAHLRAERLVVQHLEQLVASRRDLWDPRLDEVAEATSMLRRFWNDLAPGLPAVVSEDLPNEVTVAAPVPAELATRVREMLARGDAVELPAALALQEARQLVGTQETRYFAVQFLLHRMSGAMTVVEQHAQQQAARTRDPARRAAYEGLARRCAALTAAIGLLRPV